MSKKNFIALAKAIGGIACNEERARVAELIGRVCAGYNRLFDWSKWNRACNVK